MLPARVMPVATKIRFGHGYHDQVAEASSNVLVASRTQVDLLRLVGLHRPDFHPVRGFSVDHQCLARDGSPDPESSSRPWPDSTWAIVVEAKEGSLLLHSQ